MVLTDWEIIRDLDRRIAELQNFHDGTIRELRGDLRLHIQETYFHRQAFMARLAEIDKKLSKPPMMDWNKFIDSLWFKAILLAAILSGNAGLLKLAGAAMSKH